MLQGDRHVMDLAPTCGVISEPAPATLWIAWMRACCAAVQYTAHAAKDLRSLAPKLRKNANHNNCNQYQDQRVLDQPLPARRRPHKQPS